MAITRRTIVPALAMAVAVVVAGCGGGSSGRSSASNAAPTPTAQQTCRENVATWADKTMADPASQSQQGSLGATYEFGVNSPEVTIIADVVTMYGSNSVELGRVKAQEIAAKQIDTGCRAAYP